MMISPADQLQIHYEFSMAIGTSLDLRVMLRKAVSTFLRKLNCQAGGIHLLRPDRAGRGGFEQVFSIPRNTNNIDAYRIAQAQLPTEIDGDRLDDYLSSLPVHGQVGPETHYCLMALPGVGVIILLKNGRPPDNQFIRGLGPLFGKLATACQACLQNEELLKHRDNLTAMVADKSRELVEKNAALTDEVADRRRAEQRFRLAAEAMSDLIYEWNIPDDTLKWFGDIDGALGFETGELPHTIETWVRQIHSDDLTRLSDAIELHRTSTEPINYEYQIQCKDGSWRIWEDYGRPVLDGEGRPYKWVGVCKDITERRKAEQDRERLITNLQKALREIKTLRGIVPICAYCKKIRDDEGFWDQVEVYFAKHSDVDFTHSFCPDCVKIHYPKMVDRDGNLRS